MILLWHVFEGGLVLGDFQTIPCCCRDVCNSLKQNDDQSTCVESTNKGNWLDRDRKGHNNGSLNHLQ